jgi:NAD(P)-dependent dehydrogenase (short-subunit alcohol dehydrogenase family)
MSIYQSFSLTGRRAIVTGSSRGIGAAIAVALAQAGADVLVHYTGNFVGAQSVAEKIKALGHRSAVAAADLGKPGAAAALVAAAKDAFGGVDILVSNVSIQMPEPWNKITPEHFDSQVRINWQAALELIQLVAPEMLQRKWGRILTVGSVQEARPHPEMVVYASLKAAQTAMVRNLAKQLASGGVTVNNLAPGVIVTDRNRDRLKPEDYRDAVLSKIPSGFFGQPEDCAGAALLLCSDAGRYITGQSIYADGGMSL